MNADDTYMKVGLWCADPWAANRPGRCLTDVVQLPLYLTA